jgi:hypothetical protein
MKILALVAIQSDVNGKKMRDVSLSLGGLHLFVDSYTV